MTLLSIHFKVCMLKRFWNKLEWGDRINFFMLIVTIVGLIITSIFTIINSQQIGKLNYQLNSITYQPRIKVIGNPIVTDIKYDSLTVAFSDSSTSQFSDTSKIPILLDIKMQLSVSSSIKVTNVGNSLGNIFLCITTDSIPRIRDYVTEKLSITSISEEYSEMPRFLNNELLPNGQDTLTIDLTTDIKFIQKHAFIMHFLILYKNELGHMYDTYFQVQYEIKSLPIKTLTPIKVKYIPDIVRKIFNDETIKKNLLQLIASRPTYHTYDEDDVERIQQLHDRLKMQSANP